MSNMSPESELPVGFGLAMAQRPEAMERFAALPETEREALVERARNARSRQEMRSCVDQLLK